MLLCGGVGLVVSDILILVVIVVMIVVLLVIQEILKLVLIA